LAFTRSAGGVHEDSCSGVGRTESGVLEHLDPIRIPDGGYLESRRILGDHIIVTTLREVHMESMWTPEGLLKDSMESSRSLFGLLMESTRMRGLV
jgi:hypothetical protein